MTPDPTPPREIERRTFAGIVTLRAAAGETPEQIEGYAAVFGDEAIIAGWYDFREVIEPTAFTEALPRDDVRALFNHDPSLILGRNTAGTLTLTVDAKGLHYVVTPPDTSYARDLRVSVTRGDVTQSSFAFRVLEQSWEEPLKGSADLPIRHIRKVELFDVSPVTYPAYTSTTVSARAIDTARGLRAAAVVPPSLDEAEARRRALRTRELSLRELH